MKKRMGGGQFQALRQWQHQGGAALASSLPPSHGPLDPSRLPHLPCLSRRSRAASAALARPASARVPTSTRAQPPSLAAHPLQSSFTKLSDFPKPKEEEARDSSFPLLRVKSLVPTQNVRQHQFLSAAGGCDERGGRKGTDLGRRGGTARGEGGARRGAAWFLLPGSLSFGSVSKTRRGKLFLRLTPTLLKLPPPPCSRDWLPSHPLLPKSDNPDRLTGSGVNDNVYPEKS